MTGLGLGGSITFALFAVMSFLIKSDLEVPAETEIPPIEIQTLKPEKEITERDRRKPPKMEKPKDPPPPARQAQSKPVKPEINRINIARVNFEPGITDGTYFPAGAGQKLSDGNAIPMVVIQPNYPRKQAVEGVEGWVKFRFTVAADGTPKNIEVVDAKPKRVFDRAARKAIHKWKFKPRIVDGKAVEQPNMTYTLDFRLEGE